MGCLVGMLTSSRRDRRHPRWMRRIALAATTAGLVSLGGGYLALGAAGADVARPAGARATATSTPLVAPVDKDETVELPPLPQSSRAKAVAPVVGGSVASSDEAGSDAGLTGNDAKPTKAASAAVRGSNPASGGNNAVDKA